MIDDIKPLSPSLRQLVQVDLGKYASAFSVDKYFHLLNAINNLKAYIIVNFGEEILEKKANEKLQSLKDSAIYSKLKSYKDILKVLKKLQPKIIDTKFKYDDIKDKHLRGKADDGKQSNLRRYTKYISPYIVEIYFIFNLLMEISYLQNYTIPKEYLRNPDLNPQIRSFEKKAEEKTEKTEDKRD